MSPGSWKKVVGFVERKRNGAFLVGLDKPHGRAVTQVDLCNFLGERWRVKSQIRHRL